MKLEYHSPANEGFSITVPAIIDDDDVKEIRKALDDALELEDEDYVADDDIAPDIIHIEDETLISIRDNQAADLTKSICTLLSIIDAANKKLNSPTIERIMATSARYSIYAMQNIVQDCLLLPDPRLWEKIIEMSRIFAAGSVRRKQIGQIVSFISDNIERGVKLKKDNAERLASYKLLGKDLGN